MKPATNGTLSGSVCRERHCRADLREFVSLLEHLCRDTVALESDRKGEATDPSADDRDAGMGAERFRHQLHFPFPRSLGLGCFSLIAPRSDLRD
jgi:hypothetical protein